MMEIMVALAIIAIAVSSILGMVASLNSIRKEAPDVVAVHQALYSLLDRFQSARSDQLGSASWSLYRYRDLTVSGGNHGPLTETASGTDSLVEAGILTRPLGLNLRVFVEYYRGTTALDDNGVPDASRPGLMDGGLATYAKPGDFAALLKDAAQRGQVRLNPNSPPWDQVGDADPLAIRLIAVFSLPGDAGHERSIELVTGRKK